MSRRTSLIIILIIFLVLTSNINAKHKPDHASYPRSEIMLEIGSDKHNVITGQPITIYFNITNIENEAKALNINLELNLLKYIECPSLDLLIDNKNNKKTCDSIMLHNILTIESNFDNNQDNNDHAKIYKNSGRIEIYIGKLEPKNSVSIQYKTYINNSVLNCSIENICNKIDSNHFSWDYVSTRKTPKIGAIYICPEEPKEFYITIEPKYNIISWNKLNCTLFNNSIVHFYPNTVNLINDENMDLEYLDDVSEDNLNAMPINNGSKFIRPGNHTLSMHLRNSNRTYHNSTILRVVDAATYHKSVSPIGYLILSLIIVLLSIFFGDYGIGKKSSIPLQVSKGILKSKRPIFLVLLLIMVTYALFLYQYSLSRIYVDLTLLEALIFSVIYLLSYIVSNQYFMCISKKYEIIFFLPLGIILMITTYFLHPTIRSKFPNFTIFPDSDSFELNIF